MKQVSVIALVLLITGCVPMHGKWYMHNYVSDLEKTTTVRASITGVNGSMQVWCDRDNDPRVQVRHTAFLGVSSARVEYRFDDQPVVKSEWSLFNTNHLSPRLRNNDEMATFINNLETSKELVFRPYNFERVGQATIRFNLSGSEQAIPEALKNCR
ncbi:hypothetical protein [Endozoicomonas lisbonensis]|uniref:hypothetical protein n=1 Tax=Endozoicomonas lisbonensis TaxID=3120522 RepID=UPI003394F22F